VMGVGRIMLRFAPIAVILVLACPGSAHAATIIHVDPKPGEPFVVVDAGATSGWTPGSEACVVSGEGKSATVLVCGIVTNARNTSSGVRFDKTAFARHREKILKGERVLLRGDLVVRGIQARR